MKSMRTQPARQVGNVVVIKESAPGGMRKMRSPTTQQIAVPTRNAKGEEVFQTPNGVQYKSRKF